jgi:hypothetical protein
MNEEDTIKFNEWVKSIPKTQKSYPPRLKDLLSHFSLNIILENPEKINTMTYSSISTKKSTHKALTSFLKFLNISNTNLDKISKITFMVEEDKVERNFISYKDIRKKWEVIPELTEEDINIKIAIDLYINYPPLRSDFLAIKIKNFSEDQPNIHFTEKEASINIPKCVKTTKKIHPIILNEETITLLLKHKPDSDYLINMSVKPENRLSNGNPSKFFEKYTFKYLGQKVKITDFRNMAVDKKIQETKYLSPSQRTRQMIKLSQQMGHSFSTQQIYYVYDNSNVEFKKVDKLVLTGDFQYGICNGNIIIKGDYKVVDSLT